MSARQSTIGDVAALAGVSIAVASRVLNDGPASDEASKKVIDAADLLGFDPDTTLKTGTRDQELRVGVLLSDFTEGYSIAILDTMLKRLANLGYDIVLCSAAAHEGWEAEYISEVARGKVDALITMSSQQLQAVRGIASVGIPLLNICGDAGNSESTSVIRTADDVGMTEAFTHLRSLGHVRIGHITGNLRQISARERLAKFEELMEADGLDTSGLIVEGNFLRPSGRDGAETLLALDDPPTAIITANDSQMLGLLDVFARLNIEVPRQISLIGFDDIPEMATCHPPITSVAQPLGEVGLLAAEEIHQRISEDTAPQTLTVPMELVVRESTGPAPQR